MSQTNYEYDTLCKINLVNMSKAVLCVMFSINIILTYTIHITYIKKNIYIRNKIFLFQVKIVCHRNEHQDAFHP